MGMVFIATVATLVKPDSKTNLGDGGLLKEIKPVLTAALFREGILTISVLLWAGEIVQCTKFLHGRYEELSRVPKTHIKS